MSAPQHWCSGGSRDDLEDLYGDILAVWAPWATDVEGGVIDSGHHVAEEAPEQLVTRLTAFFTSR
jgi:haloacetate dehalogenase